MTFPITVNVEKGTTSSSTPQAVAMNLVTNSNHDYLQANYQFSLAGFDTSVHGLSWPWEFCRLPFCAPAYQVFGLSVETFENL